MRRIKLIFVLLYCYAVQCVPLESEPTTDNTKDSSEMSIPANMNIADYYYSIFGKHLDYDYREPLITFGETENNDLDDIESEVDRNTPDDVLWNGNGSPRSGREKRFIIPVPVNSGVFNATRRFWQNNQRLRMERRRLRMERRRQWREQRINYLNQRAETLRRQAELLTARQMQQLQQRQQTRSVPTQKPQENTFRITLPVTSTTKPGTTASSSPSSTSSSSAGDNLIISSSNQIPVKQVPIPEFRGT